MSRPTRKIELLQVALSQVGIKEIVGREDNPEVVKYFDAFMLGTMHDETAWCSAFLNWCCLQCDLPRSKSLTARSWLDMGEVVYDRVINSDRAVYDHVYHVASQGDLVIYWRESPDSWKGHVGIYISQVGNWIYTLGGNQSNSVCIMAYPAARVLQVIDITGGLRLL